MALKALTITSDWCACKLPSGACSMCTDLKDGGISLLVATGVSSITNGHKKGEAAAGKIQAPLAGPGPFLAKESGALFCRARQHGHKQGALLDREPNAGRVVAAPIELLAIEPDRQSGGLQVRCQPQRGRPVLTGIADE